MHKFRDSRNAFGHQASIIASEPPELKDEHEEIGGTGSRFRDLKGPYRTFVWCFAMVMALWHLFVLGFYPIDPIIFRASHVMFSSCLVFFLFGFRKKSPNHRFTIFDVALALFSLIVPFYLNYVLEDYVFRIGVEMDFWDIPISIGIIIIVLEMTRRSTGWSLVIISGVFLLYQFLGQYAPGLMRHPGYSYARILTTQFSASGIYDIPTGVSATYVILFVLFGAFLNVSGAGSVFTDVAKSIAGGARGGPAKVAVVASAFFGMISGAAVANVVTTGTFTIPLMKSIGYKPYFAAAVESTASTGGQVMPPVMGASVFVMAEILAIPYSDIMISAIIPALLYYAAVYFIVDFEAVKERLLGIPRGQLPRFTTVISHEGYQLFPLAVLLYCLLWEQYSVILSAMYSILTIIFFTLLKYLVDSLYHDPDEAISLLSKLWMGIWILIMVEMAYDKSFLTSPLVVLGASITVGKFFIDSRQSAKMKKGVGEHFITWLRQMTRFLGKSLYEGATGAMEIASTCACAGIIVGVMKLTGLGLKFTQTILALSHGNLPLALILIMAISLLLGMGMPTVAAYIICSAVAAPALIKMGIDPLAAHMFVFYFAVFSAITPPVCIAAFAAAAIARANVWHVGLTAVKIGFAAYLVPYMFVYGPVMLMKGPWYEILATAITGLLGVMAAAAGFQGYLFRWRMSMIQRCLLAVSALALIKPGWKTDLVGVGAFAIAVALAAVISRSIRASSAARQQEG